MQGSESKWSNACAQGRSVHKSDLSRMSSSKVARNCVRSPYMHGINKDIRGYWILRSVQSAVQLTQSRTQAVLGTRLAIRNHNTHSLPRTLSTAMNN